jgi:hypothetical protein
LIGLGGPSVRVDPVITATCKAEEEKARQTNVATVSVCFVLDIVKQAESMLFFVIINSCFALIVVAS